MKYSLCNGIVPLLFMQKYYNRLRKKASLNFAKQAPGKNSELFYEIFHKIRSISHPRAVIAL